MKNYFQLFILISCSLVFFHCNNQTEKPKSLQTGNPGGLNFSAITKNLLEQGEVSFPFSITLSPEKTDFYLPALHSFVTATYQNSWIVLGGLKVGFHGTSNNPPPFLSTFANDSIWVIDPVNKRSYGVPVPQEFEHLLAVTNPQSYQVGNDFYFCGGFTVSDQTQKSLNATSDYFFKINLQKLVEYVESAGKTPELSAVFPMVIEDPFIRISGGELLMVNDNFYLVGGQDYEGTYSPGRKGIYSNAIRSFALAQSASGWGLTNKASLIDSINLHRRDFNLVPFITGDGSVEAIIYGGVFTAQDLCYFNPVYINGLSTGKPTITVGGSEQKCNQYTSAVVPMYIAPGEPMIFGIIGGISYMKYDSKTGEMVIGDNGVPMPFSNLVDFIITDGDSSVEFVQKTPESLLPGYLGSNAAFIPLPQYTADDYPHLLGFDKIFTDSVSNLKIGYMYGGILSDGPTSGTTAKGHVNTYPNPVLYSVNLTFDLSKINESRINQ